MDDQQKLFLMQRQALKPESWRVYRARKGQGSALTVDFRLEPTWKTGPQGTVYVSTLDGGMWLQIVPESGVDSGGNATFNWQGGVRAKLGVPDISGLLVAMREVRLRGRAVPEYLGPRRKQGTEWVPTDPTKTTVGLTHRFGEGAEVRTTIIQYKFDAGGGFLSISESAQSKGGIKLNLSEELQWQRVLEASLDTMLRWGM